MKKQYRLFALLFAASLSITACGSRENSANHQPTVQKTEASASEKQLSLAEQHTETAAEDVSASASTFKLLTKENIHRTDQEDQISSCNVMVYSQTPLNTSVDCYTPDGIFLETSAAFTYETKDQEHVLLQISADQRYQTTYQFDTSGKITESKSVNADGNVTYWYNYIYDDSGLLKQKVRLDSSGEPTPDVWNYTYDESGNIIRRESNYGAWTEFTYDEEGYPITVVGFDNEGERQEVWSSLEYEETAAEPLPEFMGDPKQWILIDVVY